MKRKIGLQKWRGQLDGLTELFSQPLKDKKMMINMEKYFQEDGNCHEAFHEVDIIKDSIPVSTQNSDEAPVRSEPPLLKPKTSPLQKKMKKFGLPIHKMEISNVPLDKNKIQQELKSMIISKKNKTIQKDWMVKQNSEKPSLSTRDVFNQNESATDLHQSAGSSNLSLKADVFYQDAFDLTKKKKELNIKDHNLGEF